MKKALQKFSDEYLEQCKKLTSEEICQFLSDHQELMAGVEEKTVLISIRIPKNILEMVKQKSQLSRKKYQSQIVELLRNWVLL